MMFYFFFSSRRRHTRFDCDWSSDVCSSDLERSLAIWQYQQRRTMTVKPGDLEITRILTNVRVIKRTLGVGFLKRAIIEHVIENHGNAQCADLYWLPRLVLQRETQDKLSFFKRPDARDLQRNVSGQSR